MSELTVRVRFSHYWLHIHDQRIVSYGDFIEKVIVPKLETPMLKLVRNGERSIRVLDSSFQNGRLLMAVCVERDNELAMLRGSVSSQYSLPITHVMIDPEHRNVVIQETSSKLSGVEVAEFVKFAAKLFEPGVKTEVFLAPMLHRQELRQFFDFSAMEHISFASMELVRPNQGWTDYMNHLLTQFAAESDASTVSVGMGATEPRSLPQDKGIVGLLRSLIDITPGFIRSLDVRGFLTGEQELTIIHLNDYQVHTEEMIDRTPDGSPDDKQIMAKLVEMKPHETIKEQDLVRA